MGAGPAGLTAAHELARRGLGVTVLEQDPHYVGGIARTVEHRGFRFDIGGHRFFSKNREIDDLWTEILGDELLECGRLSRIHYRGRYFDYPLRAVNALRNLGPAETVACMLSYGRARLHPVAEPRTFEEWVSNQFGHRLFSIFFKSYTEKVWGISTSELSADWAAQRIKGLDLARAVKGALLPRRAARSDAVITTLIDHFRYPRLGPGQMWELVRDLLTDAGHQVRMGERVERVAHSGGRVLEVRTRGADGRARDHRGAHFISSLPVRTLVRRLEPAPPEHVRRAAESLKYRDYLTVALMVDRAEVFPDNWIYIHDPEVRVGRIQNFKNWSADMVPDPAKTCLGLEYFCFEGDGLWSSADADLVDLGRRELERLGICEAGAVFDGTVVRQRKAYPVYDDVYQDHLAVVREFLSGGRGKRNGERKDDRALVGAVVRVGVPDGRGQGVGEGDG